MPGNINLILSFIFGAVVGSFLNVCIYRIPLGLSVVSPPSSCPGCKTHIPFYLNIPIFSYVILGGRCHSCKEPFSIRYPIVEMMTGVFWALVFLRFGLTIDSLFYLVFVSALLVITFIDLDLQIIPDVISLPGIVVGLAASFFTQSPGVVNSIIGMIAGGGVLLLVAFGYKLATGHDGMGMGDVKLLAMIGAFLGWKGVLLTLLFGSLAGALIGILLMIVSGKGGRYALPFGPFLAAGAVLHLLAGNEIIAWYLTKLTGA